MTVKRRKVKQTTPLIERLHRFADEAKNAAARLPKGDTRDQLLKKVEVTERAVQLESWLSSRELEPPK